MRVGVIGATGYSGEVLVRLLLRHPRAELALVTSRQQAGRALADVFPGLRGMDNGLVFEDSDAGALADRSDIELFFLALPHGAAAAFAAPLVKAGRKVIDLSADFRLSDPALYETYYGAPHPNRELLAEARFVLPELAGDDWRDRHLLASPGCYPTSILLPLVPLVRAGVIGLKGIVIASFSGVSGAGRKVAEDFLFCERAESAKAYGVPRHRHLAEIEEQLALAAATPVVVQFTPHLAPMRRGILSTISASAASGKGISDVYAAWEAAYAGRPFVSLLPSGMPPDSAHVVGANRADLSAVHDSRTGNFVITSALDNLLKGAGGQAVQIMNLWCGFPEDAGLL